MFAMTLAKLKSTSIEELWVVEVGQSVAVHDTGQMPHRIPLTLQPSLVGKSFLLWGGCVTRLLTRCWFDAVEAMHKELVGLGVSEDDSSRRIIRAMMALLPWDLSFHYRCHFFILDVISFLLYSALG